MNAEKTLNIEHDNTVMIASALSEVKISGRVDINHLMARARKERLKEKKINLVFFGLISTLILVVGIILSF